MDRDVILGMPEVAERIGRSLDTLRYWRKRGEGPPSFKLGRRVVYMESDLVGWIAEQRRQGGAPAA